VTRGCNNEKTVNSNLILLNAHIKEEEEEENSSSEIAKKR
jgi:hypothetical protein